MNKKITGIISGIIAFLAGAGIIVFNINDEPENISENSVIETTLSQTENVTTTETIPETEQETFIEPVTESVTEIFSEEVTEYFTDDNNYIEYHFRNEKLLNQHFEKHGGEFDYPTASEYEKGASDVINNPDALFKTEAEDGDGVYYIEQSNEFVILSVDGYIRTYFRPSGGIDYFNRQ